MESTPRSGGANCKRPAPADTAAAPLDRSKLRRGGGALNNSIKNSLFVSWPTPSPTHPAKDPRQQRCPHARPMLPTNTPCFELPSSTSSSRRTTACAARPLSFIKLPKCVKSRVMATTESGDGDGGLGQGDGRQASERHSSGVTKACAVHLVCGGHCMHAPPPPVRMCSCHRGLLDYHRGRLRQRVTSTVLRRVQDRG